MAREIIIAQIDTAAYIDGFRNVDKFIECCKVCGQYKNSWSCPPFNSTPQQGFVNCPIPHIEQFELTTVVGVKILLDEQTRRQAATLEERDLLIRDILSQTRLEIDDQLLKLEQKTSDSLLFYAGACRLCAPHPCSRKENKACRYPDKMRSTLEAYGFDMGRTTSELLGIEMKWCQELELPPYFTLVYGLLSQQSVLDVITSTSFAAEQKITILRQ